jgi:hypothetical protein
VKDGGEEEEAKEAWRETRAPQRCRPARRVFHERMTAPYAHPARPLDVTDPPFIDLRGMDTDTKQRILKQLDYLW